MDAAMNHLRGKTVILTGASTGIGRAVAIELASIGVNLILNARSEGGLLEVRARSESLGVKVRAVVGSCAEDATGPRLLGAGLETGNLYGFIHAAGVLHPGPFLWELTSQQFQDIFDASVAGAYQMIRWVAPALRERGEGVAVFFGSGASERHTAGIGAYGSAKAAEEHLAKQLAAEAPEIATFIYRPGVVETRMQQQAREAQGGAAEVVREFFHGFRDRGELITTETAAKCLVKVLVRGPGLYHGRVVTWRDGL
jgi:NAD(P)-dependent dehydrogenase (short-subunit alcohol dehydrogenase family)